MQGAAAAKAALAPLFEALRDDAAGGISAALNAVLSHDCLCRLCHPFGDLLGPDALREQAYAPLIAAMPDLERRDLIICAGMDAQGATWVGAAGHYVGSFLAPFIGIPPTGHFAHMRYHEFYRLEDGRVTQIQAIWDLPELMMQAHAWPMAPSLGREGLIPGPMSQDGLTHESDPERSQQSLDLVIAMLTDLSRHPSEGGVEVMRAERYWHPKMNWYGPAGIGTARGFDGFRNWHQIPFLNAMPDRKGGTSGKLIPHFFAEGAYVAVTGWPDMEMTLSGDGWMGIAPAGQQITMRSLDFWRCEAGRIRENWVLVDLLDVYAQLGVDVLARLGEFNKARGLSPANPIPRSAS